MKNWIKYEVNDCLKKRKIKESEVVKEVHKKFWKGKEKKVIEI